MEATFEKLRNSKRKVLWRWKPMWELHATADEESIEAVEKQLKIKLAPDLRAFLLQFGFGNLNDEFSFRREWLSLIESVPLLGHLIFGQDDRGNLYTSDPQTGAVHYLDRFEPGYCRLARSFEAFLEEAAARGFEVVAWAGSTNLVSYPSAA